MVLCLSDFSSNLTTQSHKMCGKNISEFGASSLIIEVAHPVRKTSPTHWPFHDSTSNLSHDSLDETE